MKLRIEEIMAEKGLRKAEVARKAGLVQSNLNKAINTDGNPTVETLERIAKALEVEVYELFTDAFPSTPKGLIFLNGQTYGLVSIPALPSRPNAENGFELRSLIGRFVFSCIQVGKAASIMASFKQGTLFTVFYAKEYEPERFMLSITHGAEKPLTFDYLQDEFAETDEEGSYVAWDQNRIITELCSAIESNSQ